MMAREDDIRQINKELYVKLLNTPDIDGTFTFDGFAIKWERNCKPYLDISWDTINFCIDDSSCFHWHPEFDYDEIDKFYDELVKIGKKGNVLIVGAGLLFRIVLFIGSAEEYLSNKKRRKKKCKKYYFGDENDIAKIR